MQRYLIVLAMSFHLCFAQDFEGKYAVISDPDGYTNVRSEASGQSAIRGKIFDGELFFAYPDNTPEGSDPNWVMVSFEGNTAHYSDEAKIRMKQLGIPLGKRSFSGFIHKSRLTYVSRLQALTAHEVAEDFMAFSDGKSSFLIKSGTFDQQEHQVEIDMNNGVDKVDGQVVWGTDGSTPKEEIKWIKQVKGDKLLTLPIKKYQYFYEPSMYKTPMKMFSDKKGSYYLYMENSDGAGSYVVCLAIRNGDVLSSLAYLPF